MAIKLVQGVLGRSGDLSQLLLRLNAAGYTEEDLEASNPYNSWMHERERECDDLQCIADCFSTECPHSLVR